MSTKPDEPHDDLPDLDDPTDLLELIQDVDPGALEPIGELPDVDKLLNEPEMVLSTEEPQGSPLILDLPSTDNLIAAPEDLDDFSTQESIPMLPWRLEAELLELGLSVPAVLDPLSATTVWEHPEPGPSQRVTIRLRMVVASVDIARVSSPTERLRIGRDVLAGRASILVE